VDKWILSLAATRASRSVSPENDVAKMIQGTCGPTYSALCRKYSQHFASLKTSQLTLPWDMPTLKEISKEKATALRAESLARRKWAETIGGSDFSFWPTACAREDGRSMDAHMAMKKRMGSKACTSLNVLAKNWPTASATDWKGSSEIGQRRGQLSEAAEQNWQTPRANENGDWQSSRGSVMQTLTVQGRSFHRDLATETDGQASSQQTRRLNPLFVEWLMGWPLGWTDFTVSVTESFHLWRQRHSCALQQNLELELKRVSQYDSGTDKMKL